MANAVYRSRGYNARKLDNVLPVSGRHLRTHGLDPQAPPPLRSRPLLCLCTLFPVSPEACGYLDQNTVPIATQPAVKPMAFSLSKGRSPASHIHRRLSICCLLASFVSPPSLGLYLSVCCHPVSRRPPACCPAIRWHCSVHDHSTRHRLPADCTPSAGHRLTDPLASIDSSTRGLQSDTDICPITQPEILQRSKSSSCGDSDSHASPKPSSHHPVFFLRPSTLTPPPPLVPPLLPFTPPPPSPFDTLPLLPRSVSCCLPSPFRHRVSTPLASRRPVLAPHCLAPGYLVCRRRVPHRSHSSTYPHCCLIPRHHHPLPLRLPPPTLKIRSPPARTPPPLPPTRHCRHSARPRLQNRHLQHAPGLRHPQTQRPR